MLTLKFDPQFSVMLLSFILVWPSFVAAQETAPSVLSYDIHRVYPAIHVTQDQLSDAHRLSDLNRHFKPEWVRTYLSVEISTEHDGIIRKATSDNDILTQQQLSHLKLADAGTTIQVAVRYMPENSLKHNDAKNFDFSFVIDPLQDASYRGDRQDLLSYLQENVIKHIPEGVFQGYALAAVKFIVDENGQVIDPELFWPSEHEKTDALLLDVIAAMPAWQPAKYANGQRARQSFAFTVGNMESCVVNLLNIRVDD